MNRWSCDDGSPPDYPQVRDTGQVTKATTPPMAVLAVLATLSFLLAACGGGPARSAVASLGNAKTTTTQSGAPAGSSASSQLATEAQLLKYAVCMRTHGLSNFPDPVPAQGGGFAFRVEPGLNPRSPSPQFQSATKACQNDVPPGLANLTPAMMTANTLKYTECMRSRGEPDFPEPNTEGLIEINPTGILDPGSPQFQRAEKACQSLDNGGFDEQMTRG